MHRGGRAPRLRWFLANAAELSAGGTPGGCPPADPLQQPDFGSSSEVRATARITDLGLSPVPIELLPPDPADLDESMAEDGEVMAAEVESRRLPAIRGAQTKETIACGECVSSSEQPDSDAVVEVVGPSTAARELGASFSDEPACWSVVFRRAGVLERQREKQSHEQGRGTVAGAASPSYQMLLEDGRRGKMENELVV